MKNALFLQYTLNYMDKMNYESPSVKVIEMASHDCVVVCSEPPEDPPP